MQFLGKTHFLAVTPVPLIMLLYADLSHQFLPGSIPIMAAQIHTRQRSIHLSQSCEHFQLDASLPWFCRQVSSTSIFAASLC